MLLARLVYIRQSDNPVISQSKEDQLLACTNAAQVFYGLTDISLEFQRIIDKILEPIGDAYAFLDDILVITKGARSEHMQAVFQVL